jgi:hypothetical protein
MARKALGAVRPEINISNNGLEVNLLDDLNWPLICYQLINILLFMITFYLRIVRK